MLAESQAYEQGVSENLKAQVYDALRHLGQGFLDYPGNGLQPTAVMLKQIHDSSLIVLYRLLFMLYAEARDLLPVRENRLYAESYSLEALKSRIVRDLDDGKPAAASMSGLWQQLYEQWRVIDTGDATLGVPAYNGGLFRPDKQPFIERYRVGDLHLRQAIDLLARALDPVTGRREFVDYRDLEIRHLGSIYEGLLEYQLRCAAEPLVIVRQKGKERYEPAAGAVPDVPAGQVYLVTDKGERKATGSYYTPDYIVQYIVEQTVGPVLAERTAPFRKPDGKITDEAGLAQAILGINCLDPAMGSGHFLVAAAEYIARYVVGLGLGADEGRKTKDDVSAEPELAYWRRRVAQACIYGVDLNPLAVELAKLSLWLATVSKDKPLSFLDHHLRCGNSLIGARVADLPLGLAPVEQVAKERKAAYKAQEAARKKEEAARAAGQITMLDDSAFAGAMHTASGMMRLIEDLGSETLADVHRAEEVYRDSVRAVTERARLLGDVWTARHFGLALDETLWGGLSRYLLHGGFEMPAYRPVIDQARAIADVRRFFHWELEFPEVFFDEHGRLVEGGGFDVVMGNPPYDVLSEKERQEELSELISYVSTSADLEPACGQKLDLFRLLAAKATSLARMREYVGLIVPMSLLADQQTANLRRHLLSNCPPVQIEAFPQKDDPHRRVFLEAKLPTCVVICRKQVMGTGAIKVTVHPGNKLDEVSGVFSCTVQDLAAIDPIDLPIPLLTSNLAVELLRKLAQYPRMGDRCQSYQGEINETTMSAILSVYPHDGPRVFRGGNIQRYEFIPEPKQGAARYLKLDAYHRTVGGERAAHTQKDRIGYQRNAALDNWRRLIFAPLPNPSYCFDSISYLLANDQPQAWFLIAILNSRLLEWRFRLTSTNNHVSTAEIAALANSRLQNRYNFARRNPRRAGRRSATARRSRGHDRRLHRGSGLRRRAIGRAAGAIRRDPRPPRGPGRADDRHEPAKGRRDARLPGLAGAGNRRQDRRPDGQVAAPQLPRRLPKGRNAVALRRRPGDPAQERAQAGCRSGRPQVPGVAQEGVRCQPGRAAAAQGAAGRDRQADRSGSVSAVRAHGGRDRDRGGQRRPISVQPKITHALGWLEKVKRAFRPPTTTESDGRPGRADRQA